MDENTQERGPRIARAFFALVVAGTCLAGTGDAVMASGAVGASATIHRTTAPRSATGASERWVSVPVATLWVSRGATRSVDQLVTVPPTSTRAWIAAMTLAQKQWLVGKVETQALYGTRVTVLSSSQGWSRVVVPSQPTPRDARGYPGWVPSWQLTKRAPHASSSVAVVTSTTTWVMKAPSAAKSNRLMEVTYDTRLPIVTVGGTYVEVALLGGGHAYLRGSAVAVHRAGARWPATRGQLIAQSRKFLGLSYLWGGTSGFGYDCSGFVYSLYHALGVTIPRDAAPQSMGGVPVPRRDLQPGDLVFFRDHSGVVVHVAMYYGLVHGAASVIHSPNTGMPISITPLSAWPGSSYAGARRYLSPPT
jgi:gamma-D-glutamyl-L-lysine dipeptidyl-peptidase